MVSADTARTAVGILGNITALVLFLSPLPAFVQIWKKKSVEQYSPVPYLATFVNCGLWVLYGMPFVHPKSTLVVTINGTGIFIEFVYLMVFIVYCDRKMRVRILLIMLAQLVFLGAVASLVLSLAHTTKLRSNIIGSICIAGNVIMYAAPLSVMKLVITTRSVEYMPFLLSLFCFLNGVCWTVYAFIRFDPFIAAPNGIGTIFALAQLVLYATFYRSTKRQIAERNAKGEMGLVNVGPVAEPNGSHNGDNNTKV